MATGFNRVFMVGNVADEPKLTKTGKTAVLRLRLASENIRGSKKHGTYKEHKQFFTVVAFGERADAVAAYITKGRQLTILGELQVRIYDSKKQPGEKVKDVEIVAERFIFGNDGPQPDAADAGGETEETSNGGDNIPF